MMLVRGLNWVEHQMNAGTCSTSAPAPATTGISAHDPTRAASAAHFSAMLAPSSTIGEDWRGLIARLPITSGRKML
jgi:CelD/BcsL family acetyltransferase involved in cellulose biosynthesis